MKHYLVKVTETKIKHLAVMANDESKMWDSVERYVERRGIPDADVSEELYTVLNDHPIAASVNLDDIEWEII